MELVVLREEGLEGVWEKKTVTYKPGFQFRWQQNSSTRQRRQALGGRARNKGQACWVIAFSLNMPKRNKWVAELRSRKLPFKQKPRIQLNSKPVLLLKERKSNWRFLSSCLDGSEYASILTRCSSYQYQHSLQTARKTDQTSTKPVANPFSLRLHENLWSDWWRLYLKSSNKPSYFWRRPRGSMPCNFPSGMLFSIPNIWPRSLCVDAAFCHDQNVMFWPKIY